MTRTKQIVILSGALVVLLAVALAVVFLFRSEPEVEEAEPLDLGVVIATVNGQPVYMGEAASRIEGLTTLHGDLTSVLGEDWPDVILGSLVSDQVQRAAADELGIQITDADISSSVAEVQGMLGEGQTLDEWLVTQEMSYGEFVRRIELQLIGSRVYLAVTEDVSVSGKQIRDYYREHTLEFQGADGHTSPLLEVRQSIRDSLLKQERDRAYAEWLQEQKDAAEVVVVMEDWWKDLT